MQQDTKPPLFHTLTLTIAVAMGCSELVSAQPSAANSSAGSTLSPFNQILATSSTPLVIVPVLSNMITLTLWAFSRGSAPLIRIPLRAPTPVPTITAVGVARPSAHGQAMANTLRAHLKVYKQKNCAEKVKF